MEIQKNPTGYVTFVFGTQMIMSWAVFGGFLTGECTLYFGLLCIAVFPIYLRAGKDFMEIGDTVNASLYYMFGVLFGGVMGLCYIAQFMDSIFQWGLEYNFIGVIVLIGAIYLIPIIAMCVYLPLMQFLTWLCIDLLLIAWGISGFVSAGLAYILFMVTVWLCLISGILLLYMSLGAVLKPMGLNLPEGKQLRKFQEQ